MINWAFADEAAKPVTAAQQGGSFESMLIPLALTFLVFYFLLIRPQQKKQKEHDLALNNLKRGDNVVTLGGVLGTIAGITDRVVTLEIAEGVRIRILKSQIAGLDTLGSETKK